MTNLESFLGELAPQLDETDLIVNVPKPTGEGRELYRGGDGIVMEVMRGHGNDTREAIKRIVVYSPNETSFGQNGKPLENDLVRLMRDNIARREAQETEAHMVTNTAANLTMAYQAIPPEEFDEPGELDIMLDVVPDLPEEESA